MKENRRFRRILIWVLSLSIVSLFGLSTLKRVSFVDSTDRGFFSFLSMVRYAVIDYPVSTFTSVSTDLARFWDSRYETDALRKQLSDYAVNASKIDELELEVQKLKELNDLSAVYSEFNLISANVSNRAWDNWSQVITVNVGSDKGVAVDDAVITANGLIGKVITVTPISSTVKLITANDDQSQSAVKIIVNNSIEIQGILRAYDSETKLFEVRLMDSSATIQEGMKVYTSGIGGVYPTGLFVGTVDSVQSVADSVGVVVYIKSAVDFNSIDYVKVVDRP